MDRNKKWITIILFPFHFFSVLYLFFFLLPFFFPPLILLFPCQWASQHHCQQLYRLGAGNKQCQFGQISCHQVPIWIREPGSTLANLPKALAIENWIGASSWGGENRERKEKKEKRKKIALQLNIFLFLFQTHFAKSLYLLVVFMVRKVYSMK